jgi:hypothetical protein
MESMLKQYRLEDIASDKNCDIKESLRQWLVAVLYKKQNVFYHHRANQEQAVSDGCQYACEQKLVTDEILY